MKHLQHTISVIQTFLATHPNGIIVIGGATATGKSALSIAVADFFRDAWGPEVEVISSDSRQFFRRMDIGTDKISAEIRARVPHHQIDIIEPDGFYTAGQWKRDVVALIPEIQGRGHIPVIVGGTGLYIDTLYKNYSVPKVTPDRPRRDAQMAEDAAAAAAWEPGLLWKRLNAIDPTEAAKHHPNSTRYIIRALEIYEKTGLTKTDAAQEQPVQRPMLIIVLRREKEDTNRRIATRVLQMLEEWLLPEVESLLAAWYDPALQSMQGIGYAEMVAFLRGDYGDDMTAEAALTLRDQIILHTQQYAKRQRTWFRRYIKDKEGVVKNGVEIEVVALTE
jgi:tRNA dimethylallyltransferase